MRLIIMFCLLLSGCASPIDRMIARQGPSCEKLGFKPATESWANCVIQMENAEAARFAASMSVFQSSQSIRRPVTCQNWGSTTHCY